VRHAQCVSRPAVLPRHAAYVNILPADMPLLGAVTHFSRQISNEWRW
jgi:hypothetical protein